MRLVVFSVAHLVLFLILYSTTEIFKIVPPLFSFNYMVLNIGICSFMMVLFHILEVYKFTEFSPFEQVGKNTVLIVFMATVL